MGITPSSTMAAEQIVHEWPPLASDPAMFGKLIEFLGVENYTVNEVWGFDEELLAFLPQPCLAAIGLFMRMPTKKAEDYARGQADFECDYYMKQSGTLDNACGIIALMHAVLNNPSISLKAGSPLAQFRDANTTAESTPETRCAALEASEQIHDFYKTIQGDGPGPADGQEDRGVDQETGEVRGVKTFHFVAYVRNEKGQLVEYDGTKAGPWACAEGVEEAGFMVAVANEMKRRVADEEIDGLEMAVMAVGPPPQ